MDDRKGQAMLGQISGKAVEAMTVWADASQQVLRELVEFSAATAKESVRLYAELQQGAIEALRVDGAERAFALLEGNAQALARSAERLQTSAEQTGKGIQETCVAAVAKMKDVCAQN